MRGLDVRDADRPVGGDVVDRRPALVDLAPGGGVRGRVAPTVPRAAAHEAPVAHALGRVVGVVEVREAEEEVAQLVGGDPELGVLGDGEVAVDLRGVGRHLAGQDPLVRPDVAAVAGLLTAAAGVDDDEGVDIAVAVVVVGPEAHVRVGERERVGGHVAGAGGARGTADAEVAVGIPGHGLREAVGPDDLADDVDQAVADLTEVLPDTPRRDHAGREEEVAEGLGRPRHRLVRGVGEDDDDPHRSPQWCPLESAGPHDRLGRPERERVRRHDQAVVEAEGSRLLGGAEGVGDTGLALAQPRELGVELLAQLRRRGDETRIVDVLVHCSSP